MPKISRDDADNFEKHGIELWDYFGADGPDAGDVLYVETDHGHEAEFSNDECHFFYYILNGNGRFFLDGEEITATKQDLIHVPPETKVYYEGALEMLLFCSPAWHPEQETVHRTVDLTKGDS